MKRTTAKGIITCLPKQGKVRSYIKRLETSNTPKLSGNLVEY